MEKIIEDFLSVYKMRQENTTLQLLKSGNACVTPSGISKAEKLT